MMNRSEWFVTMEAAGRELRPAHVDAVRAHLEEVGALAAELEAKVDMVREQHRGQKIPLEAEYQVRNMSDDLKLLEAGVRMEDGVRDPRLEMLRGVPGIATLRLRLAQLERQLAEEAGRPSGPSPCRYTGPAGRHEHEGRLLQPGDVITLSPEQQAAFGDRFEPVAEADAVAEEVVAADESATSASTA
jgi:hypothetical protein